MKTAEHLAQQLEQMAVALEQTTLPYGPPRQLVLRVTVDGCRYVLKAARTPEAIRARAARLRRYRTPGTVVPKRAGEPAKL